MYVTDKKGTLNLLPLQFGIQYSLELKLSQLYSMSELRKATQTCK